MNPTAIYSKSGKGVQEASGKTSLLKRPDRAVLSAIDGRATLGDVAQKCGKTFDADFQKLVTQLDKDGFIREVSPGASTAKPAAPAAKAPPKPAAPMDAAPDLDFSMIAPAPRPAGPPPAQRPAAPPARPAPGPVAKAPPPKEQQNALNKAREEAEAKAGTERDRIKAETEAKVRAELESKARAETEEKMKAESASKAKSDSEAKQRADTEAKIKAARDAAVRTAAEAKAKSDAESRRVREEADKAKRESEELKQRLEEERKGLEEKQRKDEEERAERRRREEEEEKERRKKREEEERKAEEERAARRKREDDEEKARQKKKEEDRKHREEEERRAQEERAERRKREEEEEERKAEEERAARRKKREEEEAAARAAEEEERRIRAEEEDRRKSEEQKSIAEMATKPAAPAAPAAPAKGGGFDSLLADLDSFGKKDEEDAKAKDESDRKAKAEAARRAEETARDEREEEERKASEESAAKRKRDAEEEERKAEEERAARRKKREEEDRKEEEERKAEEKKRKEKEEAAEAKKSKGKGKKAKDDDDIPVSDDDLDMDDVKRDQRALAGKKKERAYVAPPTIAPSARRRPANWGKPVAIGLILLLAVAVGVVHVLPLTTTEYEQAASEAIGRPVKIASGRIWLFTGLQLKLQGVTVGDNVKIANVTAYPTIDTLSGDRKTFTRIDLEGVVLAQQALGEALFAKVKGDKFTVARVVVKQLELAGPMPLPKGLEADIGLDAEGGLRTITVRGPDTLVAKLTPKDSGVEFEVNAGGFIVPIAPQVTLGNFAMKGTATRQGVTISEWDGAYLNGTLRGTANVRWGSTWTADGVITARGINAAVFAPALVSEGRAEGTAKFTMSGPDPAKLGSNGRYDGSFKVESGALGSVDLSLALKTSGRQTAGRTPFTDLTGQATYERGAVSIRNVQIGAGALNAGASADINREGGLSGRIVADVRVGSQTLRATLNMSGTAKDPQFRN